MALVADNAQQRIEVHDRSLRDELDVHRGQNIDKIERLVAEKLSYGYAVDFASSTSALHMAVRLVGSNRGKVFCSDLTVDATANPVKYEGSEAVFIYTEYETWNRDPEALKTRSIYIPRFELLSSFTFMGRRASLTN